ncbi:kinase-like protein [Mycena floridula]|nr:kinase-like protein [Mycena floridula]
MLSLQSQISLVKPSTRLGRRQESDICAQLVTVNHGRTDYIDLKLDKPVKIGRDPDQCHYVVEKSPSVSTVHCILHVVRSPNGGFIVSCQDKSKNGIYLNNHRVKGNFIIMNGDKIKFPGASSFTCYHARTPDHRTDGLFSPSDRPKYRQLGHYIVTSQCLGEGSFAKVHLAFDKLDNHQVACKSIKTKGLVESKNIVCREISVLQTLHHPNINQIYTAEEHAASSMIHIFLQLCTGGDLFTYVLENNKGLVEMEAKFIMFQLLKGLGYLHKRAISHRDLKPENILLYKPGPYPRIVIADFGLARVRANEATFNVCGTVAYLPPEGIKALECEDLSYVGMPSDCWSAGVILYIMLSGRHPFDSDDGMEDWISHVKESQQYSQSFPESLYSDHYVAAESRLKHRIIGGTADLQRSPFPSMQDATDLITSFLQPDYRSRSNIKQAAESRWITRDLDSLTNAYREWILKDDDAT